MTNEQIILNAVNLSELDFIYTGKNLKTYASWMKSGYRVKKGEKAILKTELWTPSIKKVKDKTGKEKKETRVYLRKSALFSDMQVEKIK